MRETKDMITATTSTPFAVGPDDNGLLMTPEEFDAVTDYDENYHYELIHGVLVVNPIPRPAERDPNEELGHLLRPYREAHPGGLDRALPDEYVRLPHSRRRADRVIWAGLGRTPNPQFDIPTMIVEFVSRGRRDRDRDYVLKRDEYLGLGVAEYWGIDRFDRTLTVFRNGPQGQEVQQLREQDVYRPALLPGFELPLARLLSVADDWNDS
jgi:Uma2 family endonuclease